MCRCLSVAHHDSDASAKCYYNMLRVALLLSLSRYDLASIAGIRHEKYEPDWKLTPGLACSLHISLPLIILLLGVIKDADGRTYYANAVVFSEFW